MTGTVGPNAILQLRAPLLARGGEDLVNDMLRAAGLTTMPSEAGMIDETLAARAHAALPSLVPDPSRVAHEAGTATAQYILAHRIPKTAQRVLRRLPAKLATPLLTRAIARHAWTFSGSGTFNVVCRRPLILEILQNPLHGANSCCWHIAVFETLYQTLADPRIKVTETTCRSRGDTSCRFKISRHT